MTLLSRYREERVENNNPSSPAFLIETALVTSQGEEEPACSWVPATFAQKLLNKWTRRNVSPPIIVTAIAIDEDADMGGVGLRH